MTRLALAVPEAAEAVGVTEKTIRAAIHSGDLKAKRQSRNKEGQGVGKYLVKVSDLETWFDSLVDA
jgi:excisionase family DNA binding protein